MFPCKSPQILEVTLVNDLKTLTLKEVQNVYPVHSSSLVLKSQVYELQSYK